MTQGQCGSLHLHWQRLALFTPCRSPGARIVNLSGRGMLVVSVARQLGSGNSFVRLLCCPAQAERGRCAQLVITRNWQSAFRDETLGCGASIPGENLSE